MFMAFLEIIHLPFIVITIGGQSLRENKHRSVLASLTTIPDFVNLRMIFSSFVFILSANLDLFACLVFKWLKSRD